MVLQNHSYVRNDNDYFSGATFRNYQLCLLHIPTTSTYVTKSKTYVSEFMMGGKKKEEGGQNGWQMNNSWKQRKQQKQRKLMVFFGILLLLLTKRKNGCAGCLFLLMMTINSFKRVCPVQFRSVQDGVSALGKTRMRSTPSLSEVSPKLSCSSFDAVFS